MLDLQSLFSHLSADHEGALRLIDLFIAKRRQLEDSNAVVQALLNKWLICANSGESSRALQSLDRAIEEAEAADVSPALHAMALVTAAKVHLELGNITLSRSCIQKATAITSNFPQMPSLYQETQLTNADIALAESDLVTASEWLTEPFSFICQGEMQLAAESTFLIAAKWFRLAGDRKACLSVLQGIGTRSFDKRLFEKARAMLRELGEELQPQADAAPVNSQIEIAEIASVARRRMLVLLDEMQRKKRLQGP